MRKGRQRGRGPLQGREFDSWRRGEAEWRQECTGQMGWRARRRWCKVMQMVGTRTKLNSKGTKPEEEAEEEMLVAKNL
jgi:hypothetical protein